MGIGIIPPVEDRPEVSLGYWQVFEVPLRGPDRPWTRHLAGWSYEDRQGQVSSAVKVFDPSTKTFITSSGRRYRLMGSSGLHDDAAYVWTQWKAMGLITEERDVTSEVVALMHSCR